MVRGEFECRPKGLSGQRVGCGCAAGMRVELWQDVARLVQAAGETCLGDGLRTTERLEVVRVRGRDVAVRVRTVDDTSLNPLLAACNAALKQAGFRQGEDLTGWECRVWEPDRILEEGIVRVIVVDPRGIGHDLTALADGTDPAITRADASVSPT